MLSLSTSSRVYQAGGRQKEHCASPKPVDRAGAVGPGALAQPCVLAASTPRDTAFRQIIKFGFFIFYFNETRKSLSTKMSTMLFKI